MLAKLLVKYLMADFKKIVCTVKIENPEKTRREIYKSFKLGADIVEIRIDSFNNPNEAKKLFDLIPKTPLIFSGNRKKIIKEELYVLLKAHKLGAYIDIPFVQDFSYPTKLDKNKLIISYHGKIDSYGCLERSVKRISQISNFIKIVPPKDNIFLCAQFLKWIQRINRKYNLIAFPSGNESKFARILSLAFGSKWVYCLSPKSKKTVKGQIGIRELLSYKPKEISKKTFFTGLIGFPLNFTLSPQMWNRWFEEHGFDARYLPFVAQEVQNAIEAFKLLNVKFFAVTTPHKNQIIKYLDTLSNKAKKSDSVNTVIELKDGTLFGFNTDIYGIRRALSPLKRKAKILILGSGGVARSVIFALKKSNSVFLSSRNEENGKEICNRFGVEFIKWNKKEEGKYDLVINATSAGADNESLPWNQEMPINSKMVLDLVVTEEKMTPFEKFAHTNKVKILRGKIVLEHQARLQFRIFKKLFFDYF